MARPVTHFPGCWQDHPDCAQGLLEEAVAMARQFQDEPALWGVGGRSAPEALRQYELGRLIALLLQKA